MSRGIGEVDFLQGLIPEWLAVIVALLTQLGDIWFLGLLLAVLYWAHTPKRDEIAMVGGVWLAGMGFYKGLKEHFEFPRPDDPLLDPEVLPTLIQPLYEATAMASGYGFPSGHAVNTTIVYFGLAYVLSIGSKRARFATAAAIVTTVCFTRLALGVHYLVDVVVGVGVGFLVLLTARELIRRMPSDRTTVTLGMAIICGVFFLVTSEVDEDAVFVLSASLGAFAGWQVIILGRRLVSAPSFSAAVRPIAVRGGLVLMALAPLVATFEYFPLLSVYTAGGGIGLLTAVAITIPVARHSDHARRIGSRIRFWIVVVLHGLLYVLDPRVWRQWLASARNYLSDRRK
ncbi:phosphatase PAP2 family protein [Halobacteria archaeon AArc-dxtr1]|nr:phosphatase PAP2 family protein [Halobacteria archaeon AArc-dxtr1]